MEFHSPDNAVSYRFLRGGGQPRAPFTAAGVNGDNINPPFAPARSNSGVQDRNEVNVNNDQHVRPSSFVHHLYQQRYTAPGTRQYFAHQTQFHVPPYLPPPPNLSWQPFDPPPSTAAPFYPDLFGQGFAYLAAALYRDCLTLEELEEGIRAQRNPSPVPHSPNFSLYSGDSSSELGDDLSDHQEPEAGFLNHHDPYDESSDNQGPDAESPDYPQPDDDDYGLSDYPSSLSEPLSEYQRDFGANQIARARSLNSSSNGSQSPVSPHFSEPNFNLPDFPSLAGSSPALGSTTSLSSSSSSFDMPTASGSRVRKRRAPTSDDDVFVIPDSDDVPESSSPVQIVDALPPRPVKRRNTRQPSAVATSSRQQERAVAIPTGPSSRTRARTPATKTKSEEEDDLWGSVSPGVFRSPKPEDEEEVVDLVDTETVPIPEKPKADNTVKLAKFQCVICMDDCTDITVTHCGHLFCSECLHSALHIDAVKKTCPVCRTKIDTNPASGQFTNRSKGFWPLELKLMTKRRSEKRAAR